MPRFGLLAYGSEIVFRVASDGRLSLVFAVEVGKKGCFKDNLVGDCKEVACKEGVQLGQAIVQ